MGHELDLKFDNDASNSCGLGSEAITVSTLLCHPEMLHVPHLSRMEFPSRINWSGPIPILGLLGWYFSFLLKILKEHSVSKEWIH